MSLRMLDQTLFQIRVSCHNLATQYEAGKPTCLRWIKEFPCHVCRQHAERLGIVSLSVVNLQMIMMIMTRQGLKPKPSTLMLVLFEYTNELLKLHWAHNCVCFQGKAGIPGNSGETGPHGEPVSDTVTLMWLFQESANKPQILMTLSVICNTPLFLATFPVKQSVRLWII